MRKQLNSPGHIGALQIKNRAVMTAARTLLSDDAGRMTEDLIAYYERRAAGGVGLIITEAVCVDERYGRSVPNEICAGRAESVAECAKLAARIQPYGARLFAQLFHPGANGDAALSPGGLISADEMRGRTPARQATEAEISHVVACFGRAARHIKESGFDGVEVHAAHNYFIQSFLSPATNHRQDAYGGSFAKRLRLLEEIVQAIRSSCGADFPLMVRVSLEEYIGAAGYHADEGILICQRLEALGVQAIHVTAGGTSSKQSQSMEPVTYREGWRKHLLRAVKRSVNIPVCGVATVRSPALAEALLQEGYADFIGSVRAHLADPDWTKKACAGADDEIVRCISCMACLEMEYQLGRLTCALNPHTGYEAQLPPLQKDGEGRLVLVLGAGPAGMQAALTAAQRGFQVHLYEENTQSGGQLRLAGAIPRKGKILWAAEDLERRCRAAGVVFHFGCRMRPEELAAARPYALLDATGGRALIPASIEGAASSALVCTPEEVITGRVDVRGESVVVVGSGLTGLETAELLSEEARENAIVVMEAAPRLAPGALGSNRNVITALLDTRNVVYFCKRTLTKIDDRRVYFRESGGTQVYTYPCDRVVLALGVQPAAPYGEALAALCPRVIRIGDANRPGKIWHAVHSGYQAAAQL